MNLMVPTLWVNAMCACPISAGGKTAVTGEIMRVPYGVALQGLATGAFSTIENASEMHAHGIAHLQEYGPDSWFPQQSQTLGKFWAYVEQRRAEKAAGVETTTH